MKVYEYLKKNKYEMKKAAKPSHVLAFIPYKEHQKVLNYFKKHEKPYILRFTHDYTEAILFFSK